MANHSHYYISHEFITMKNEGQVHFLMECNITSSVLCCAKCSSPSRYSLDVNVENVDFCLFLNITYFVVT